MTDDIIWLTYNEAAKKLGISLDSVRRKARKEFWAKRKNNAGKITVAVPIETGHTTDQLTGLETGHPIHELQKQIAVLEVELISEKNRANTAEKDRDAWKEQAQILARPWWKRLAG